MILLEINLIEFGFERRSAIQKLTFCPRMKRAWLNTLLNIYHQTLTERFHSVHDEKSSLVPCDFLADFTG